MWIKKEITNYKKSISETEEIRDWFKVSSNRKKVRNVELWLIEEIKKICKKHNIMYYAAYGTLLWAVRHKWFIPWDDDCDIVMFRKDYEKFWEIAPHELPDHIKLCTYHQWFSKLINLKTSAFCYENRWDEDFFWGIRVDIFPIDYASKLRIINWIKSIILLSLRSILISQKAYWFINIMGKLKKFFILPLKFIFKKIDCSKIYELHEKISKKTLLKSENVYSSTFLFKYFPKKIYDKSHEVVFEGTTINIPDWYDTYLKIQYGDYMKRVIAEWGHFCKYSVTTPYKDIIKSFDKTKSNEENYNNFKDFFIL